MNTSEEAARIRHTAQVSCCLLYNSELLWYLVTAGDAGFTETVYRHHEGRSRKYLAPILHSLTLPQAQGMPSLSSLAAAAAATPTIEQEEEEDKPEDKLEARCPLIVTC